MRFHGILIGSFSTVLLLSGILAAWPQEVPVLDLNPICRGIAQGAAGAGTVMFKTQLSGPPTRIADNSRLSDATVKIIR